MTDAAATLGYTLHCGDALSVMAGMADKSVDAVITDPPYPEIDRAYGRMTEAEWWEMMMGVCTETRRLLKPTGSAVFILQPNSRKVGSMRGWLWEFMAWVCREWNMVQDVWWWNYNALPVGGAITSGLMRGAIKPVIWCGPPDCYRSQSVVLLTHDADYATTKRRQRTRHSGGNVRNEHMRARAIERGGSTPHNLLEFCHDTHGGAGAHGHPAGTPLELAKWWTRYICPPGGTVLDPFTGSGTMGLAALAYDCLFVGIERDAGYHAIAQRRIEDAAAQLSLFAQEVL